MAGLAQLCRRSGASTVPEQLYIAMAVLNLMLDACLQPTKACTATLKAETIILMQASGGAGAFRPDGAQQPRREAKRRSSRAST